MGQANYIGGSSINGRCAGGYPEPKERRRRLNWTESIPAAHRGLVQSADNLGHFKQRVDRRAAKIEVGNISELEQRQLARLHQRLCGVVEMAQLRQFSESEDHPDHSALSAARSRASTLLRVLARLQQLHPAIP